MQSKHQSVSQNELSASIPTSRRQALLSLLAASVSLHGCGGGGSASGGSTFIGGVGSGGTGSFTVGVVTGFGSIIVNGVRYDDSSTSITDEDNTPLSSSDLKIGSVVAITGSSSTTVNGVSRSVATSITSYGTELKGPIESFTRNGFIVLGQTVSVNTSTIYSAGLAGLPALRVGNLVEVHGFADVQNNSIMASLIELKSNLSQYRLTGQISSLNTAARTFNIGSLAISYASADVRITPSNGAVIRVRLDTVPSSGTRNAVRLQGIDVTVQGSFDSSEIRGTITSFTSISQFSVNGISVQANASTTYPDGTAGLTLGARVEIKGGLSAGLLTASTIKLEDIAEIEAIENEFIGTISSLNTIAKTFVVRGVTVDFTASTIAYINGTASNLANGQIVEVRGKINATSARLEPTRIKFEL